MARINMLCLLLVACVANGQATSDGTLDVLLRTPQMKRVLEENYQRAVHKRLGMLEAHGFFDPEEAQLGWGFTVSLTTRCSMKRMLMYQFHLTAHGLSSHTNAC
jgi:hypothetical protein